MATPTETRNELLDQILAATIANAARIVEVSGDYTVIANDDYIVSSGDNIITLLALALAPITVKSVSGTATLDGNGNSIENGPSVTESQARKLLLVSSGYVEVT
jgi:hypothetical protein